MSQGGTLALLVSQGASLQSGREDPSVVLCYSCACLDQAIIFHLPCEARVARCGHWHQDPVSAWVFDAWKTCCSQPFPFSSLKAVSAWRVSHFTVLGHFTECTVSKSLPEKNTLPSLSCTLVCWRAFPHAATGSQLQGL